MYFNSEELSEIKEVREEQISDFLTDGWGCVRIKDIMRLFDLSKIDYTHGLRSMLNNHIKVVEHSDYVAVEYFPGYEASKKYMNTISALVALKNQHKNVIITDDSYSTLFTAKM